MAKCIHCGTSGLTLKIDFDGLCQTCHTNVCAEKERLIESLQSFKNEYSSIPDAKIETEHILSDAKKKAEEIINCAIKEAESKNITADKYYKDIINDATRRATDIIANAKSNAASVQADLDNQKRTADAELRQIKVTIKKTIADANQAIASLLSVSAHDFAFTARTAAVKAADVECKPAEVKKNSDSFSFVKTPLQNEIIEQTKNGFIIFDLETTGLSPIRERIVEIGAIKCDANSIPLERFTSLVNPGKKIPSAASSVNHIYDDMVQDAPKIKDILPKFIEFIGDLPLIAHNAGFDIGFLKYELERCSFSSSPKTIHYIDTLGLARELYSFSSYRLDAIAQDLCIYQSGAHRSGSDCETLRQIFSKMRRDIKSNCEQ